MADTDTDTDQEQSLISHLVELRAHIMRMIVFTTLLFFCLFFFADRIYQFVAEPLIAKLPEDSTMIATEVATPFLTPFKLTLFCAVFLAIPYIIYQIWAFIAPGLYMNEKRLALPLLISSIMLFYLGVIFAYFAVFPILFAFLTTTAPEGVRVMTDINHYLNFILKLFFAFGISFEIPVATFLVVRANIVSIEKLSSNRPYIILLAFVVGMLLTPPDVISQILLAVPIWLLFEAGLLISRYVGVKQDNENENEPDNQ